MQNQDVIQEHAHSCPFHYLAFDVLTLKGESLQNHYLKTRKEQLGKLATKFKWPSVNYENPTPIQVIHGSEEHESLWQSIKLYNGEGIVAKKKTSKWLENIRSNHWLKIKIGVMSLSLSHNMTIAIVIFMVQFLRTMNYEKSLRLSMV